MVSETPGRAEIPPPDRINVSSGVAERGLSPGDGAQEDGGTLTNGRGDPLRILVVGASSGIGAATAHRLAESGAQVVGAARRSERVARLGVVAVACDVAVPDDCARAVDGAVDALGGLDALVYAAGTTGLTPLDRAGVDRWTEIFAVNLFGAAQITRLALPHLLDPDSDGRALYLTSDSADKPYPGLVAYGASKAALSAFCLGLAAEFAPLRVTEVVVGPTVDTEVSEHFDPDEFGPWFERWCADGFVRYGLQMAVDVAGVVSDTLRRASPPAQVMAAADPT
jgi:NAD(P)-dependent dehydrogenase (short-subunit alcohol dehydrogenase family)